MRESERIQGIVDELIRVTSGLIEARTSFDTPGDYLLERTNELDEETLKRVSMFLVLEVLKARRLHNDKS